MKFSSKQKRLCVIWSQHGTTTPGENNLISRSFTHYAHDISSTSSGPQSLFYTIR